MYQHIQAPILVGIDNIAAQNNLYTFTDKKTGQKTKIVEELFGLVETRAAPALEKISRQRNLDLTGTEYVGLAEFTAFLITRGPSFSEWQRNMTAEMWKWETKAKAVNPDGLRKTFAAAGVTFESEEEFWKMRDSMLNFEEHFTVTAEGGEGGLFVRAAQIALDLTELFMKKKSWHLLVSRGNRVFVTSDNPVVVQKMEGVPLHLAEGFGYGTVFLTISPKICLVMRSLPLKKEVIKIDDSDVDRINRSIMKATHRQIYSNLKSRDLKRMRDEFPPGQESHVTSSTFGPYVMTRGLARDFELSLLARWELDLKDL